MMTNDAIGGIEVMDDNNNNSNIIFIIWDIHRPFHRMLVAKDQPCCTCLKHGF